MPGWPLRPGAWVPAATCLELDVQQVAACSRVSAAHLAVHHHALQQPLWLASLGCRVRRHYASRACLIGRRRWFKAVCSLRGHLRIDRSLVVVVQPWEGCCLHASRGPSSCQNRHRARAHTAPAYLSVLPLSEGERVCHRDAAVMVHGVPRPQACVSAARCLYTPTAFAL